MPFRTILHAAVLALANLAGIWLGFVAFALASTTNQLAVQMPVAVVVSIGGFAAWAALVGRRRPAWSRLRTGRDAVWVYGLALVWSAVVFVPLHLLLEGYRTAFSNVVALWVFQLVVNAVAVPMAMRLGPGRSEATGAGRVS
ncbi:hypothetical protein GF314_16630 [bacterium]|nr:hypothetical protein [bacterium]